MEIIPIDTGDIDNKSFYAKKPYTFLSLRKKEPFCVSACWMGKGIEPMII
jgi:hypothetical protein